MNVQSMKNTTITNVVKEFNDVKILLDMIEDTYIGIELKGEELEDFTSAYYLLSDRFKSIYGTLKEVVGGVQNA